MQEAIDYDALGWVRQELEETLKQARLQLEAYAADVADKAPLGNCAAQLHQTLGPLQMVGINGAVLLVTEMEELITDLLQESVEQPETAHELLMQAFLKIPDYLASLGSGQVDCPELLLSLINEMRMVRGAQALEETVLFSPDLSVRVPPSVFDVRAEPVSVDITAMARAARVRFQSGQLEWYRGGTGSCLQDMMDVLKELQHNATSEPVARVWWVATGVTEALRDEYIESTAVTKKLLGRVDQSIKRLMDSGENTFIDSFTDDLMRDMLFQISRVASESDRIALIQSTYGLQNSVSQSDGPGTCNDEILEAVSGTVRSDIERIKSQIDNCNNGTSPDFQELISVADGLHNLGNTLSMIGMDAMGDSLAEHEQLLRSLANEEREVDESCLADLANTLVAVEDALGGAASSDNESLAYMQGLEAVTTGLMENLSRAKEAISEYIKAPENFELLAAVPDLLNQVDGGLQLSGQGRAGVAIQQTGNFIVCELIENKRTLSAEQLELLADAICSIEFHIEASSGHSKNNGSALELAEQSMEKLGYPCPQLEEPVIEAVEKDDSINISVEQKVSAIQEEVVCDASDAHEQLAEETPVQKSVTSQSSAEIPAITSMQIIDAELDAEILEIFIEEADEEMEKLSTLIPEWTSSPDNLELLTDVRRSFHTLKGSGRMVGALAVGEFSWAFETLLNNLLEGVVSQHDEMRTLLGQSLDALSQLMAQVKDHSVVPETDVNYLAHQASVFSKPGNVITEPATESVSLDENSIESEVADIEEGGQEGLDGFPVLSADADPEIVEIFLEEAAEILVTVSESIPAWVNDTGNEDALATSRRHLHTLKGSGRMAGALYMGEYCWSIESLLARVIDGSVSRDDPLFSLLGKVPEVLEQLVEQVGGKSTPTLDINGMMQLAEALQREKLPEPANALAEENAELLQATTGGEVAGQDDELSIIDIYRDECSHIMRAIDEFLGAEDEPRVVTDSLFRALHTLSGISESAEVNSVSELAGDLNVYFEQLHESQQALCPEAVAVLRESAVAISQLLEQLPDLEFDEAAQAVLRQRVVDLPQVHVQPVPTVADASTAVDTSDTEDTPDPYVDLDPELYEIFVEEAGEVIENSDAALRSWIDAPDNMDAMAEFSRHLHTLKGGARMVDIHTIGDLSHAVESLMTRVTDGQVATSDELFSLLRDSHDQLSDMLELVKVREVPAAATELETALNAVEQDEVVPVISAVEDAEPVPVVSPDPYADLDPELYEIFVEEAGEVIESSDSALQSWTEAPDNMDAMAEFSRHLHTLKGGARMVDMHTIGDMSHAVESLMTRVTDGQVPASDELFSLLRDSHDQLSDMVEQVKSREVPAAATGLEAALNAMAQGDARTTENTGTSADSTRDDEPSRLDEGSGTEDDRAPAPVVSKEPEPVAVAVQQLSPGVQKTATPLPKSERRRPGRVRNEQVRVQSELLDDMVNHAGEISIYRSRLEQQASNYRFNLIELDQTITRLRDQLRQLEMETEAQILFRYEQEVEVDNQEFDPLEMDRYSNLQQTSRSLIESIDDLRSIQELMELSTRESETLLLQQSRVSTDLQEGLMRTRMIPFAGLAARLRRVVRQSSHELGKKVELSLVGAEGEIDRNVIDRIIAPIDHMLRNAVAHGIELPAQRLESGKQAEGSITISFEREGSEIVLRIADDGAGMDIAAIRSRAIERGLMSADAGLSDMDVMQFVLQTGFSTATEVTQISGRGVGMDVVNSEVKQLGGMLKIESTVGQGTLFTVRLPYTLAINQALLVTAGEETFCVPLDSVEGVVRANPEELVYCYNSDECLYRYAGNDYQLKHLASLLDVGRLRIDKAQGQLPVLLVRVGEQRIALQVESLIGSREVVVKPVGAQLSTVDCISGATILGDGSVVVILDIAAVSRITVRAQLSEMSAQQATESRLVVMVVDDSITVRKVTTRLLERNGFKVLTAKDGVDAMGQLQDVVPDMMLLDIEMPRMDGFELATHMRNDTHLKHIPIIMITSRTGDKHRERAEQIGVNDYLGKPYQENELLERIQTIVGVSAADEVA